MLNINQKRRIRSWWLRVTIILIFAMGIVNLISGLYPPVFSRSLLLRDYLSLDFQYGGRLTVIFAGFLLLLIAYKLYQRKKVAWYLAEAVLIISAIANIVKGLDIEEALLAMTLFASLLPLRKIFYKRSNLLAIRQIILLIASAWLVLIAYAVIGFYTLSRRPPATRSFPQVVSESASMMFLFYTPPATPRSIHGRFFVDSLMALGVSWYVYALFLFLSPVIVQSRANEYELEKAEQLITLYGADGLANIALLPDKKYFFAGNCTIAYTVKSGVALVLGDPIGDSADVNSTIRQFIRYCTTQDWTVAFYQAKPAYLAQYQQLGFKALPIGQDSFVELDQFELAGSQRKNLRNTYTKLKKLGYSFEVLDESDIDVYLPSLKHISDAWLEQTRSRELHFSLGWFDEDIIRDSTTFVIFSEVKEIVAFITAWKVPTLKVLAIDLMRFSPAAMSGTMDFGLASLLLWAKEQGMQGVDLGLSALTPATNVTTSPLLDSSVKFVSHHLKWMYDFEGVYRFKQKFAPQWSPRYLVYEKQLQLPAIGLALTQAHFGNDPAVTK